MRLWQAIVVVVLIALLLITDTEARRKDKNRRRNKDRTGVCKYKGRAIVGVCDMESNTKQVMFKLKKSRSASNCQPVRVETVACDDNSFETKRSRRKMKKQKKRKCKYERKGTRGECDPLTNKMELTKTLKANQPAECPQTITKFKKCRKRDRKQKKVCRFDKGEWSECSGNTTHSHRRLTPKAGSPEQCKMLTQTKTCSQLAELTAAKPTNCRYKAGPWSECDPRSDTMTKVWTLKNGDPNCRRVKTFSRKCKNQCRFRRGEWSECDQETELTTRVDMLVKGNTKFCDATRNITRKCKKSCKYEWGEWSTCSEDTNQRSRIGTLIKGDPQKCQVMTTQFRSCTNRNGEDRCFFGPWGDFGPCQNGVMTKNRQLLQGGVECARKAAMNRACDDVHGQK